VARKVPLPSAPERALISEMLPYEVPAIFSNQGVYQYLIAAGIKFEKGRVSGPSGDPVAEAFIRLVFGINPTLPPVVHLQSRRIEFPVSSRYTVPFSFPIGRSDGQTRLLTVPHLRNQMALVDFYDRFAQGIIYSTSKSPISLRKPVSVAKYTYTKDQLHRQLLSSWSNKVEVASREYESLRSYFAYRDFSSVYKFYDSTLYLDLEKKFSRLVRLDVSKCFDSIYTHTISWATQSKAHAKDNISSETFGDLFDRHLQSLNYNETNGIVIGPEFSRIFAEVILQSVDVAVLKKLESVGLERDKYRLLRYVDDYFVFTSASSDEEAIEKTLISELREFNLHLNVAKRESSTNPGLSPLSIAKLRVSRLLQKRVRLEKPDANDTASPPRRRISTKARRLITEYKLILTETGVAPAEILNYTLSVAERRLVSLLRKVLSPDDYYVASEDVCSSLVALIQFAFFAHSAAPRVNPTIKLTRLVSHLAAATPRLQVDDHHRRTIMDALYVELREALELGAIPDETQVESLYLVTALRELGPSYLLPASYLCERFGVVQQTDGTLRCERPMNFFAIATLLHYTDRRRRYSLLTSAVERHAIERVRGLHPDSAERLMLVLDLSASPAVSIATKSTLLQESGIQAANQQVALSNAALDWFVRWRSFDLGSQLDAKRNQEVY
jgi:hypothetical protein